MTNYIDNSQKIGSNKSFGYTFSIVFILAFLYFYIIQEKLLIYLIFISIIFLVLGFLNSKILNPLNFIWFKIGIFLGNIISPIVMGIIYFIIVTPTGLLLKLFNKDILGLKKNNNYSYWKTRSNIKSSMKNQY